jgi:ATP-dependent protease HslVU (ClpYQ) peptidase subunit
MTVIAFDGTSMAADKMNYNGFTTLVTKVRLINGMLVGIAGRTVLVQLLFKWAENGFSEKTMPASQKEAEGWATIMCVMPNKEIRIYENSHTYWVCERKYHAIGSGGELAIGALANGKNTAKEAVDIAIEHAPFCGGGVDVITFDVKQTRRKK